MSIEYSTVEVRKVMATHHMDLYHKDLMTWLCDQVDEYHDLEQKRLGLKMIRDGIKKYKTVKITGPALCNMATPPFPPEWEVEEIDYIDSLKKILVEGEDAMIFYV